MTNKLPHNLSVEELLKIANEEVDTSVIEKFDVTSDKNGNDVMGFLSAYDIQPGPHSMKIKALYKLYKTWSQLPCSKQMFSICINTYFECKHGSAEINKNIFEVHSELQSLLKTPKKKGAQRSRHKHFEYFLEKHSIIKGDIYIEGYILYNLYDKWCYKRGLKTLLSKATFENFCSLYFTNQRRKIEDKYNIVFFGVNKEVYDFFTSEQLERLRDLDPYGRQKKEEKSNQG